MIITKQRLLSALPLSLAFARFVFFIKLYWSVFFSKSYEMSTKVFSIIFIDPPIGGLELYIFKHFNSSVCYLTSLFNLKDICLPKVDLAFTAFGFPIDPGFILIFGAIGTLWWYFVPKMIAVSWRMAGALSMIIAKTGLEEED